MGSFFSKSRLGGSAWRRARCAARLGRSEHKPRARCNPLVWHFSLLLLHAPSLERKKKEKKRRFRHGKPSHGTKRTCQAAFFLSHKHTREAPLFAWTSCCRPFFLLGAATAHRKSWYTTFFCCWASPVRRFFVRHLRLSPFPIASGAGDKVVGLPQTRLFPSPSARMTTKIKAYAFCVDAVAGLDQENKRERETHRANQKADARAGPTKKAGQGSSSTDWAKGGQSMGGALERALGDGHKVPRPGGRQTAGLDGHRDASRRRQRRQGTA